MASIDLSSFFEELERKLEPARKIVDDLRVEIETLEAKKQRLTLSDEDWEHIKGAMGRYRSWFGATVAQDQAARRANGYDQQSETARSLQQQYRDVRALCERLGCDE